MAGTNCCQGGWRALIASKLGRCPRCIRASAFGALAGWTAAGLVYVAWPIPVLLGVSLLVSVGFTVLLLAHVLTLFVRLWTLRGTVVVGDAADTVAGADRGRRVATGRLLRAGMAVLLGTVFGVGLLGRPREAGAGKPCDDRVHNTQKTAGSQVADDAPICVRRSSPGQEKQAAEAQAAANFAAAARTFATTFCGTQAGCLYSQVCKLLRIPNPAGLSVKCEKAELQQGCGSGEVRYLCDVTVHFVQCQCG